MLRKFVLWQDLAYHSSLSYKYLTGNPLIETIKLGTVIYVNKSTIPDILIRAEAENCKDLSTFYPLSELLSPGITAKDIKELKSSGDIVEYYGVQFFKIPDEINNNACKSKKMILQFLQEGESEEGYETVVEIKSSFKIASYDI